MDIVNPFEELVVFGKKLPLEPVSSTIIGALRPTGRHLGHANDLGHFTGGTQGGPATRLERYTTSPKGLRQGPFKGSVSQPKTKLVVVQGKGPGKGFRPGPFGKADEPKRKSAQGMRSAGSTVMTGVGMGAGMAGGERATNGVIRRLKSNKLLVHKGLVPVAPLAAKGTVARSLGMIKALPKPTAIPHTVTTSPRLAQAAAKANPLSAVTNSNIPHAAKVGSRL